MHRFILTGFLFGSLLCATEVDSFTERDPSLIDATEPLNLIVQNYFDRAIPKANRVGSCDRKVMEDVLHDLIGGIAWSDIERQVEILKVIDKRHQDLEFSIYRDVTWSEGFALHIASLGYLLRFGDLYIGSDKLGHFLDTGYYYYRNYDSLDDALKYGEIAERTYYGLATTGVYSYGDLSANLEGYTFWEKIADGSENAYFTCSNNIWQQQRDFTWETYINPAMDEGINCNFYKTPEMTQHILANIAALGMSCPVKPGYCDTMKERYGLLAPRVVSAHCFD